MLLLYHKVLGFIYVQRELEKNKNESLKDNYITQCTMKRYKINILMYLKRWSEGGAETWKLGLKVEGR